MEIKGNAMHLGYLYWFISQYGWVFRKGLAEIGEDAGGLTYEPIRHQLRKLEELGYLTIERRWKPYTVRVDKDKVLRELNLHQHENL